MDSNAYTPRHRALSGGDTYDALVASSRRSRAGLVSRLDERRAWRARNQADKSNRFPRDAA